MSQADDVEVEVRWSDVDAYGHVSHIALVALAEHGRSRWFDALFEAPQTWPYVVARLELDYRAPLTFEDHVVRCRFQPVQLGTSSIQLDERLTAPDGRVVLDAKSVIVVWDEAAAAKRPLSDDELGRLRARSAEPSLGG